jgi:DTW domain-containing protein
MAGIASARRAVCAACLRPQTACICRWVTPIDNAVEVVILQHPMEVANAKGSARLLHLCLARSKLIVGEQFAGQDLDALIATAHAARPAVQPGSNTVLLYPDTPAARSLGIPAAPAFDRAWLDQPGKLRLVVLDGTWRKSRKMLYLNPALHRLPRLPLRNTPASQYLIRKAQAPDQLSTLEATCYALMQLERNEGRYAPLLAAFDGFVAQQMGYAEVAAAAANGPGDVVKLA